MTGAVCDDSWPDDAAECCWASKYRSYDVEWNGPHGLAKCQLLAGYLCQDVEGWNAVDMIVAVANLVDAVSQLRLEG